MICPHCNEYVPDTNYRCPKCRKVVKKDLDLLEAQPKQSKRGGPTFTHFLLIIIVVGLGVMAFFMFQQNQEKGTDSTDVKQPAARPAIKRPAQPIEKATGSAPAPATNGSTPGKTTGQDIEQPAAGESATPGDKPAEGESAGASKEEKSSSDSDDPYAWVENEKEESQTPTVSHIPGEEVDITQMVVKGKTTIFDFFSTYCPPCVKISPKLAALDNQREDIVVIKIDINRDGVQGIDWASPVVKQYAIKSIPYFVIFDDTGARSHEGNAARQEIENLLALEGIQ